MCHISSVLCQVSGVRCQVSHANVYIYFLFLDNVVKLVGGGSVINGATPASLNLCSLTFTKVIRLN